jgi:hypothetical protein
MPKATVGVVEIAELLGVSKQRAHQLAGEDGFPFSGCRGRSRAPMEPARGHGVAEGRAAREALAVAARRHTIATFSPEMVRQVSGLFI